MAIGSRFRAPSSASVVQAIDYDDDVVIVVADDLSSWEFVEPSDDEEDCFSYHEDEDKLGENDLDKDESVHEQKDLFRSASSDISIQALSEQLEYQRHDYDDADRDLEDEERVEDENEDDNREYDLDDDLVPWGVSNRFGKQRLKKSGKKAYSKSKMKKSKAVPCYFYNRPCSIV